MWNKILQNLGMKQVLILAAYVQIKKWNNVSGYFSKRALNERLFAFYFVIEEFSNSISFENPYFQA